jgi:hypothetical protein
MNAFVVSGLIKRGERLAQVGPVEAIFRASQPAKPLKSQPTAFHR